MRAKIYLTIFAAGLLFTGCGKKEGAANMLHKTETAFLEQSFSEAEPEDKAAVQEVSLAIKRGDYGAAEAELVALSKKPGLNMEQISAISVMLERLEELREKSSQKGGGEEATNE